MAQSTALREQPSMDEILASIRRIIDAGEGRAQRGKLSPQEPIRDSLSGRAPEPTIPPSPANDARGKVSTLPQAMPRQEPRTRRAPELPASPTPELKPATRSKAFDIDVLAAVDDYLEDERSKAAAPAAKYLQPMAQRAETVAEPSISEVEAALEAEFQGIDRDILKAERQAKYDARFTPEDNGAFQQVASVLLGTVGDVFTPRQAPAEVRGEVPVPRAQPSEDLADEAPAQKNEIAAQRKDVSVSSLRNEDSTQTSTPMPALSLVSDQVSQTVSHSLSGLATLFDHKSARELDKLAQDLLRPMLQDWLDNNLPSLVERMVRSEIERIARGESVKRY